MAKLTDARFRKSCSLVLPLCKILQSNLVLVKGLGFRVRCPDFLIPTLHLGWVLREHLSYSLTSLQGAFWGTVKLLKGGYIGDYTG